MLENIQEMNNNVKYSNNNEVTPNYNGHVNKNNVSEDTRKQYNKTINDNKFIKRDILSSSSINLRRINSVVYCVRDRKLLETVYKYRDYIASEEFVYAIDLLYNNPYLCKRNNEKFFFNELRDKAVNLHFEYKYASEFGEILDLDKSEYYSLVKEYLIEEVYQSINLFENDDSKVKVITKCSHLVRNIEKDFSFVSEKVKRPSFSLNSPSDVEEKLKSCVNNNIITTGLKSFDYTTNGGFKKGTLNLLMGGTGNHKTTFLCNLALSCWKIGYNVIYVTLEIYGEEILKRLIANYGNFKIGEIDYMIKKDNNFITKVKSIFSNKINTFKIYELPSGLTTPSDIEQILIDEHINGNNIDVLVIDYINLLTTNQSDGNSFKTLKEVAEGLRVLSRQNDVCVITATQVNRMGLNSEKPSLKDISESYGMATYSDFIAMIQYNRNIPMYINICPLKNRYGHLVDVKIQMEISGDYMRISDYLTREQFANIYNVNVNVVDEIIKTAQTEIKRRNDSTNQEDVSNTESDGLYSINENNLNCEKKLITPGEKLEEVTEISVDYCIEEEESEKMVKIEEYEISTELDEYMDSIDNSDSDNIDDEILNKNDKEEILERSEMYNNSENSNNCLQEENRLNEFLDEELSNTKNEIEELANTKNENENNEPNKDTELFNLIGNNLKHWINSITNNYNTNYKIVHFERSIKILKDFNEKYSLISSSTLKGERLNKIVSLMNDIVKELSDCILEIFKERDYRDVKEKRLCIWLYYYLINIYENLIELSHEFKFSLKTDVFFIQGLGIKTTKVKTQINFADRDNKEVKIYLNRRFDDFKEILKVESIKDLVIGIYRILFMNNSPEEDFSSIESALLRDYDLFVSKLKDVGLYDYYTRVNKYVLKEIITDEECIYKAIINWLRVESVSNGPFIKFNNPTPFTVSLYKFMETSINHVIGNILGNSTVKVNLYNKENNEEFFDTKNYSKIEDLNFPKNKRQKPKGFK